MKLAVVGSRSFNDYSLLCYFLDNIHQQREGVEEIVSGGAQGADSLAEKWAQSNQITVKIFVPDWTTYGRSAGPKRNKEIVKYSDSVIAFWDGVSPGTKNTIMEAKISGKLLGIVYYLERRSITGSDFQK